MSQIFNKKLKKIENRPEDIDLTFLTILKKYT